MCVFILCSKSVCVNYFDFSGLLAWVTVGKAIGYASTPGEMLRKEEVRIYRDEEKKPAPPAHAQHPNGNLSSSKCHHAKVTPYPSRHRFFSAWFLDACDLMFDLRGLEWEYGSGVYVPSETRSLSRTPFIRATFWSFIQNYFLLDLFESLIKCFPGVGHPEGGTMFYPNLPLPQRLAVSTTIHIFTGSSLLYGFGMVYDLLTLIGVLLFNTPTTSWPPVIDNPWASDSLHAFWSRRWHQLLRYTFLIYGGYPGYRLGGGLGMVVGTFVASGMYHECSAYALGRGFEWGVPFFFALQAPLLIGERIWRKVTGKRVGGWKGMLWVYFCIMILGQPLSEFLSFSKIPFFANYAYSRLVASPRSWRGYGDTPSPQPNSAILTPSS